MNIAARHCRSGSPIPGAHYGPQMCQDWVWMHGRSLQFCVTQGRTWKCSTVSPQPAVNCIIYLPHLYPFFYMSALFLPGGCSISPPVLSMPSVGFYLDCAVCPTSQLSPVSAGSKCAAQTMVRCLKLHLKLNIKILPQLHSQLQPEALAKRVEMFHQTKEALACRGTAMVSTAAHVNKSWPTTIDIYISLQRLLK